VKESNLQP